MNVQSVLVIAWRWGIYTCIYIAGSVTHMKVRATVAGEHEQLSTNEMLNSMVGNDCSKTT